MTPTPLSEIADKQDGEPVICVEGTVKFASDVKTGKSKTGTDWSRQFFVLAQNGAEVGVTLWDAQDNEVKKGEQLRIENTQNKKGQWTAITKQSYQKDGKLNHTLEVRAEHAKIRPVSNGEAKGGDATCSKSKANIASENATGNATSLTTSNAAPTSDPESAANGITEARKHLCQAANLYNLCVKAVDVMIAPELPEVARTSEQFQAAVGTLFIQASREGYVARMPMKPIHNGNGKAERVPSNQEEHYTSDLPDEPEEPIPF